MKVVVLAGAALLCVGCMTSSASRELPSVNFDALKIGMDRDDVDYELGGNSAEKTIGAITIVNYSFLSSNAWSKRSWVYAPFSLADVIFAPIELSIQRMAHKTAEAVYSEDGSLVQLVVRRADGKPMVELGRPPIAEYPARRTVFDIVAGNNGDSQ